MTRLGMLCLLYYILQGTDAAGFNISGDSCMPAVPRVSPAQVKLVCYPYMERQTGYCRDVIGDWLVKKNPEEQRLLENDLQRIDITKRLIYELYNIKISRGCLSAFNDVYCRWSFPKCDTNTAKLTIQTICRESCEHVYKMCAAELKLATPLMTSSQIMNCSKMAPRNGGESPGCYHTTYSNTETDKLPASECYYGNGFGYRGNASITRSGHVCQSWSSQCPHRHDHVLSVYPELINASNLCRNPGGQGPKGPWCYTTNSSVRWEYCDVEKCPPPAPSRAPTISQVFARGSNKVYLSWRPVPLPFVHGQLRGFRIFVRNVTADERHEREVVADPSVTSIELNDLEPLTNYSLSVLAFNENGDGPCSRRVFVQTMPKDFISVQFMLTLKRQTFHHELLEKQSRRYQTLAWRVKRKVWRTLKKPKPKGYRIFHIEISRFSKGSVIVEFYITAQVLGSLPYWSIVQDITGRMVPRTKAGRIDISSLAVQYVPPPPANVSHSETTVNSAKVSWSAPLYHEPYRIKNYTIQYKKANTKMAYYDAVTSNNTNVIVDNLDVETKYLMRVVSVNAYGSSASQPITVQTKRKSTNGNTALIIALSVTAAVIVVTSVIIVVAWRRWSQKRKYLAQVIIHDRQLFGIQVVLLLIDLVILLTWQMIDPLVEIRHNMPLKISGDSAVLPYVRLCDCKHMMLWKAIMFCYQGLLLLFGTYLAWETRKVHIPALNDSKLIGMCVYNTVILFAVVIPVQAVLQTIPTASFALMAFLTIYCTSFTLCVVFIPKMIFLRNNDGNDIQACTGNGNTKESQHNNMSGGSKQNDADVFSTVQKSNKTTSPMSVTSNLEYEAKY